MDKYKETELKIIHFSIKYKDKLHRLIEYGVDRSWFREANIAAMWAIICEFYIDKEKSRLTAHNFIEYLKSKNVDSIKLAKYKNSMMKYLAPI